MAVIGTCQIDRHVLPLFCSYTETCSSSAFFNVDFSVQNWKYFVLPKLVWPFGNAPAIKIVDIGFTFLWSNGMAFVTFTRPDGTPVSINTDEVIKLSPVPTSGPTMGPLSKGTRIQFRNNSHQDVKELVPDVEAKINAGS